MNRDPGLDASGSVASRDARALVLSLLSAFGTQDLDRIAESLHDEVSFELPFEAAFSTKHGKAAVMQHFEYCFDPDEGLFTRLAFEVENVFVDGSTVVVEYRSSGELREFAAPYRNRYVGVFTLRDGAVVRWREYANPLLGTRRRLAELRAASEASARGEDAARRETAGHDTAGHDTAGHDTAGHEAAGHDAAGYDAAGENAGGADVRAGEGR